MSTRTLAYSAVSCALLCREMEPWQEEMPTKKLEWSPEREENAKQPQRAATDQPREASPLSHRMAQTKGTSFDDEGERPEHGDTPSQESADAKLQQPNGFERKSLAEEKETPKGQEVRPTLDDSGLGGDEIPMSPGEEMSILKRSVKEHLQPTGERRSEESLMRELSEMVQAVVKSSSWWERHGIDDTVIALNFLALPVGFLLLRSDSFFPFSMGIIILGIAHHTISVKASHQASHYSLTESKSWGKLWAVFFIEVCSAFTAEQASYNHVKIHHGYTNVIGLGDSSTWKLPFLNRYIYMFISPIIVPIATPIVAIGLLKDVEWKTAIRTLCCMFFGLCSHYWLLINISGFQSVLSALCCMMVTRSLLAHPFIHVNIFQHIGLAMFSVDKKPKRIYMMTSGVLNLPRNPLLDWSFGHSIISCHVEHHLFPTLSDHMCLKIKPVVSQYLKEKKLPYNEDTYLSRLKLFLHKYEELMVHAPPITELVGIQ